jgi:hypothetical protein
MTGEGFWKCTKCGAQWRANAPTFCADCAEPRYPEHEKLHAAKEELKTEELGRFLEWLQQDGIQLARFWKHEVNCESIGDGVSYNNDEYPHCPSPFRHQSENGRWYKHKEKDCGYENDGIMNCIHEPIMKLLARYAGIDLERLENEKRAMLDEVRKAQQK